MLGFCLDAFSSREPESTSLENALGRWPPARRPVLAFRNLSELGALQFFRRESVELLKAHDQRPPFVGIDAVGLALHHDLGVRVHAGDADLDRHEIACAKSRPPAPSR